MIIQSKYLGEVTIEKEKVIRFELGLPGFETEKDFVLLDIADNLIFQVLQSIQTSELAFFVVNPYLLFEDYSIEIKDHVIDTLDIQNQQDVAVLAVMTLKEPFIHSTVNLKAPLLINLRNKQAKQYILDDDRYSMRAAIPQQITERGVKEC